MRKRIPLVWVGLLLLMPLNALGDSTPKSACPSLDGEWFGQFEGSYSGEWAATFSQTGNSIRATATITLESGQQLEAEGSAGISCEGKKTAVAGSGSAKAAKDRAGSFSGVSDVTETHLSGTWWSGDLAGTWSGQRTTSDSTEEAP